MEYARKFRKLLNDENITVSPGVHDPLSARVADGFPVDMLSMTGNGTSLSKPGIPDAGLITMSEMVENAANIQETVDVPVIADADNGYGNAINTIRTIREFIKAGVAGVHIEDQSFPKRCGFVEGKRVIPKDEAVGKFQAAAAVRDERAPEFVIIARTDARGTEGGTLDDAVDRVNTYCGAGADVAFLQGPKSEEEVEQVAEEVDAPLLYNVSASSPQLSLERLEDLGYAMVMFPRLSTLATIVGFHRVLSSFEGDEIKTYAEIQDKFNALPFDGFNDFAGIDQVIQWEAEYLER